MARPRLSSVPGISIGSGSPGAAPQEGSTSSSKGTSVQVAVRVRPLNGHDQSTIPPRWQRSVITPASASSIQVEASGGHPTAGDAPPPGGSSAVKRQAFTFDHVLGPKDGQEQVYTVAQPLISRFLDGYNVTILAYGQTSSGKSYTMGTSTADVDFEGLVAGRAPDPNVGIIPRAVADIFSQIKQNQQRSGAVKYTAKASFIEIYNEELIDLLADTEGDARPHVQIREDKNGRILWSGLREPKVASVTDVMNHLLQGSAIRRTNETDMNAQSSRSHAIFSLTLTQQKFVGSGPPPPPSAAHNSGLAGGRTTPGGGGRATPSSGRGTGLPRPSSMLPTPGRSQSPYGTPAGRSSSSGLRPASVLGGGRSPSPMLGGSTQAHEGGQDGNWVTITSKFHFVDLAGSERLKRTAAQGERVKEGISINAGLHALGNVISALGDPAKAKRTTHIPYRDSKLTRLLQDSLGGNAHTLMVACVSPTEYNVGETVNTLQYANRARNIKNKAERNEVEVGWDDVEHLQTTVIRLRKELSILRGAKGSGDVASLQALEDKEILKWQGMYTEESQKCSKLTAELTKLQQTGKGKAQNGDDNEAFLAAAEPIIVEYEKTLDALEGRLNLMKAALSHSEDLINESEARIADQEQRIINAEQQLEARESTIVELQSRLAKVQDRESTAEGYARDLEARLQAFSTKGDSAAELSSELKKEIARLKDEGGNRESYIKGLEERLAKAEDNVVTLTSQVERLERDIERRDEAYKELQQRLEFLDNGEQTKALVEDFQRSEQSNLELRAELDRLKAEKESVVKERGRLNDAAANHELQRGHLEDRVRELESAVATATAAAAASAAAAKVASSRLSEEATTAAAPESSGATSEGETAPEAEETPTTKVVQENGPSDKPDGQASEVDVAKLQSELDALRQEVLSARESEAQARLQAQTLSSKYQDTLTEMHALNVQLSEAKLTAGGDIDSEATVARAVRNPRSENGEAEPEELLEELSHPDASSSPAPGSLSRRGSFQYSPLRSPERTTNASQEDGKRLLRRSSGSFFGYNPRQGGLDSPSRRERPRSLSQSLSAELSQGLSQGLSGGHRPLSLSGTVPPSPTSASPGGKPLEQRLSVSYDRKVSTLEKGVLSLQEALKKRDAEIAMLEQALRESQGKEATDAATAKLGPPIEGINGGSGSGAPSSEAGDVTVTEARSPFPSMSRSTTSSSIQTALESMPPTPMEPSSEDLSAANKQLALPDETPAIPTEDSDTRLNELMRSMARQEEAHREKTDHLTNQLDAAKQKVEDLERMSWDQQTSYVAEIEALRAQLNEQVGAAKETPKAAPRSLADEDLVTQELDQLRRDLAESRGKLTEREEAFEQQLQAVRNEQARDLTARAPGEEGRAHTEALARMAAEHQTAMEMTVAEHQGVVEKLIADHGEALSAREASQTSALQQAQKQHEQALLEATNERNAALEQLSRDHAAEMEALQSEHARTLASQLAEKDGAQQETVTQREKSIQDLSDGHAQELLKLRSEHEEVLSKHRTESEAAIAAAAAAATAAAASQPARSSSDADMSADLEAQHKAAIEELEQRAQTERQQALADAHNAYTNERQRMVDEHEARIADIHAQHEKSIENLTRRLSTFRDVDGDVVDIDTLRLELSETSDALVTLEDALTNVTAEKEQLAEELAQLREVAEVNGSANHHAETNSLRKEIETHKITLANLKTELQRSKSEIQSMAEERVKQDQQIKELQEKGTNGTAASGHGNLRGSRDSYGALTSPTEEHGSFFGNSNSARKSSAPPPTPPPNMPPPPTPAGSSAQRASAGPRASLSSLMTRSDSPGPTSSGGGVLTRSSSATSMHASSPSLNGMANQDAKKLLADQSEELKNLAKQLAHCEADLQANIDLVTTLEAALNDSERNLRKSRVQLGEVTRERDRYAGQADDLRQQLTVAQKEVDSVRNSVMLEKQDFEQKIRQERAAKEKAARDLEARMEEINRKKSSKLFCM